MTNGDSQRQRTAPEADLDEEVLDPGDPVEEARGLRAALRRHAVDMRPVRITDYRRLLVGQGTAFIGSMVTQVAVPVEVYSISHSSLLVGLVGFVGLLPLVVFGLYGGAIADAVDRGRLYFWSSVGTWLVTIALLAQTLIGLDNIPVILGLVAVQAGAFAVASSARGAIIPRIVPADLVASANTLNFTVGNVGQVIGPLLAGLLISLDQGFAYAYGLDAVLFTAALYSAIRLPPLPPDRALYPEVADERFHGSVGPLYAALAIGSVLAGISGGWIARVRRRGVALTGAVVAWGTAVAISGLAHQLWLVVILLALAGAADLVSAVFRQTILQTYAPDEMRGRMQGVFIAVVAGGPRLGDVRAGAMAAATSATVSWVGGGVACVVVVLVAAIAVRPFWNYRVDPTSDEAVSAGH
jgi:MFS family permease